MYCYARHRIVKRYHVPIATKHIDCSLYEPFERRLEQESFAQINTRFSNTFLLSFQISWPPDRGCLLISLLQRDSDSPFAMQRHITVFNTFILTIYMVFVKSTEGANFILVNR